MPTGDSDIIAFTTRPVPRVKVLPGEVAAKPRLRVLIIDDTPEDRMVVRLALEAQGFMLNEVDNGERGLKAVEALRPDCILLDYHLPDLDGFEVLRALRRPDGEMQYPVVMLTDFHNGNAAAKLLKAGAFDYLAKQNLNEDSLRHAVKGAVERFRFLEERRKTEERNTQLAAIVMASADAIFSVGLDHIVRTWNPGATELFGYTEAEAVGRSIDELIVPDDRLGERARLFDAVMAGQHALCAESVRHRKDGSLLPVEINVSPMLNASGRIVAISILMRDISERKRAEEKICLLMKEVDHRSKNILSVVLAVAQQTLAASPREFVQRFTERVKALAASHDLLIKNAWQGIEVADLVRAQLAHFIDLQGQRIVLTGGPFRLSVAAAQTIGMVVHELATNAAKHGALSNATGRIEVGWQVEEGEANKCFTLSWIERDGPPVAAPKRRGFGWTVVKKMAATNLEGQVQIDYPRSGLVWRLACPVEKVAEKDGQ